MRAETEEILIELRDLDWFHAVGQPVDGDVTAVGTWQEAIRAADAYRWQKIKLAWRNELTVWLCNHSRERFDKWNDLVTALNLRFMPIVETNVRRIVPENLQQALRDEVNWDILHLLMEAEYSDLAMPKYYAALGLVYLQGHFPCGWDQKHSGGRMIVY